MCHPATVLLNINKTIKMKSFLIPAVLIFISVSCKKQDDQYSIGNSTSSQLKDIITFSKISSDTLQADSVSVTTIEVKINAEADSNNRDVTFTTSGGLLTNNDTTQKVHVNTEGYASVSLLDIKPEKVHIKASILSYTIDTTVAFTHAFPDDILFTSDKYIADTTDTITVSAQLFRNAGKGKVSDPIKVLYKVTPIDTTVNLVYPEFSFSQKQVSNIAISNPFKIKGNFDIEAKVQSFSGDTLSKMIRVIIK